MCVCKGGHSRRRSYICVGGVVSTANETYRCVFCFVFQVGVIRLRLDSESRIKVK